MSKAILGILIIFVIVGCQSFLTPSRQSNTDGKDESADAAAGYDEHDGIKNENREITTHPGYESPMPIIVTEKADYPLPAGCSPRRTAAIVVAFVDAFNRGDREMLDRIFQPLPESRIPDWEVLPEEVPGGMLQGEEVLDPRFQFGEAYGMDEGQSFTFAYGEKNLLLDHFAERRRLGERMELLKVQVNGQAMEGVENTVGMTPLLSRRVPDLESGSGGPERLMSGKGAIDCERQAIFGWAVSSRGMAGGEGADAPPSSQAGGDTGELFCKEPDDWKPGESVLACT